MYDYPTSQWHSLVGWRSFSLATSYTQEQGIERGHSYMFRYRAWNVNGPGPFSEISYLVAASPPSRPPTPVYGSSSASSITLLFGPSSDDGGKIIIRMELVVSPLEQTSWVLVSSYDGQSMGHTLTTGTDVVTAYTKYRFRIRAVNEYGPSAYSEELVASIAPLPTKFSSVEKDQDYSSATSIMVRWTDPADGMEPILGYALRMTDAATRTSRTVYDAPTNRNVRQYLATGLEPGGSYSFSVLGVNFNGAGMKWSDAATFRACT
jgi:hypothetical protein